MLIFFLAVVIVVSSLKKTQTIQPYRSVQLKEALISLALDSRSQNFSLAFTILCWSLVEFKQTYITIEEYDNLRAFIKGRTDEFLGSFSSTPSHNVAGDMVAALAAASIVFQDDHHYSQKVLEAAASMYYKATIHYKSVGYYDEQMWMGTWMFYATGNESVYLPDGADLERAKQAMILTGPWNLSVLKLTASQLLLTRYRLYLDYAVYPYRTIFRLSHEATELYMCWYLDKFNRTQDYTLENRAYMVFLVALFSDYIREIMTALNCGDFVTADELLQFTNSKLDLILKIDVDLRNLTWADNASLVAALVSSGGKSDRNNIFWKMQRPRLTYP